MRTDREPARQPLPIGNTNQHMAGWLRKRRAFLRKSQEEVAQEVSQMGVTLSRAHYANLERGTHELKAEHIAALDVVLEGNGELVLLAHMKWQRALRAAHHSEWARVGKDFEAAFFGDRVPLGHISAEDHGQLVKKDDASPVTVIDGRDRVTQAVVALLEEASRAEFKGPKRQKVIRCTGKLDGWRGLGKVGFPREVRFAVRPLLESGWHCEHYIPVEPDQRDDPSLVYISAPLIACRNFEARLVDVGPTQTIENLMIVPGVAVIQFFATASATDIDAAVIHRDEETRWLLEERVSQLADESRPFVNRFERSADPSGEDEIRFRETLVKSARIEGACSMCIGWFPSPTIPPKIYEKWVKLLSRDSAWSVAIWDDLIDYQRRRSELWDQQLQDRFEYRVIVTEEKLKKFSRLEPDGLWEYAPLADDREAARTAFSEWLQRVLKWLSDRPSFRVAIAPQEMEERISRFQWSVREGAADGLVFVQTEYTACGTRPGESRETGPVDLEIRAPEAVNAFMAYSRELWSQCTTDRKTVTDELQKALAAISPR